MEKTMSRKAFPNEWPDGFGYETETAQAGGSLKENDVSGNARNGSRLADGMETMFCKDLGCEMAAVRVQDLDALVTDRDSLYVMLESLIGMWSMEDKLRKHHRPYLHVRGEMEQMCRDYMERMAEISARIVEPMGSCAMQCLIGDEDRTNEDQDMWEDVLKYIMDNLEKTGDMHGMQQSGSGNGATRFYIHPYVSMTGMDMPKTHAKDGRGCAVEEEPDTSSDSGYERSNGEEVFSAMLDDLMMMADFVDTQDIMINLMNYGVDLQEITEEFGQKAKEEIGKVLDRWEDYARSEGFIPD